MTEFILSDVEQMRAWARDFAKKLQAPVTVALHGDLGMGKSEIARTVLQTLRGAYTVVPSPTFTIVQTYDAQDFEIYHFDMYRITTFEDLCSTGFFDYLDSNSVLAIEWSENIENALPEDMLIRIEIIRGDSDNQRILRMSGDSKYENSWR